MSEIRVAAVGAVIRDHQDRLLLIRRDKEPGAGLWSLPGGKVEPGETDHQALVREVSEETGLRVVVTGAAGYVERSGPGGVLFEISDFHARLDCDPGQVAAGDDAREAGWFSAEQVRELPCVEGLIEVLVEWGVLPPTD